MSSASIVLALAVFLASAVEMVEALTIVVAVGTTRGWRSAFEGVGAALATLAAVVALLGPALVSLIPIGTLRLVVGGVLLVFGMQWLRKAVLRAAGLKAKHDENEIFQKNVSALSGATRTRRDAGGFTVAFKGVFLEGLEVVIIVITLGSTGHALALAAGSALVALVVVGAIGAVVARQLAGVPENAMKMGVGIMLVSFGTFWGGEGLGMHWPGTDLAIPVLIAFYALGMLLLTKSLAARYSSAAAPVAAAASIRENHVGTR